MSTKKTHSQEELKNIRTGEGVTHNVVEFHTSDITYTGTPEGAVNLEISGWFGYHAISHVKLPEGGTEPMLHTRRLTPLDHLSKFVFTADTLQALMPGMNMDTISRKEAAELVMRVLMTYLEKTPSPPKARPVPKMDESVVTQTELSVEPTPIPNPHIFGADEQEYLKQFDLKGTSFTHDDMEEDFGTFKDL